MRNKNIFIYIDDGEDYVVMNNGKLSDIRGFRKYPFFCQYDSKLNEVEEIYQCLSCQEMIMKLRFDILITKIVLKIQEYCEIQFSHIFDSKTQWICSFLTQFLNHAIKVFKVEFIDSNEVCTYLQECYSSPTDIGDNNCSRCIFITKQFKKLILDNKLDEYLGKYFQYVSILCYTLKFDCKYLENVALINGVIDPPTLCSKIDLCDA